MRKLYDFPPSGNCHKVRILMSLLGLSYDKVTIDLTAKDQMRPEFLALNPMHKVPVLDDDGFVLTDSSAILVYLATKYDGGDAWYPDSPDGRARVQTWLSLAVNEVFNGLALSRAMVIFNRDMDAKALHAIAKIALDRMEGQLSETKWLALDQPSLADIACYPYTAAVGDGNLSLDPYPSIRRWIADLEAIPDFLPMPPFSTDGLAIGRR